MPNRIIKESIRTSRDVNALTDFQFRVWVHLITYADDYGRGSADTELLKGLVFPRRKGITEKQIADALSVLANSGMISLYEVDGESYFCFPTWEKHQQIRNKKSKYPAPDGDNCRQLISIDINCSRNPIQTNPNPNTESESSSPPAATAAVRGQKKAALFDAFWEQYPRKVGKGDARKSWDKLELTEELADRIFHALQRQKAWEQWQRDEGRFIPHPATWLNQQRWEDEGLSAVADNGYANRAAPAPVESLWEELQAAAKKMAGLYSPYACIGSGDERHTAEEIEEWKRECWDGLPEQLQRFVGSGDEMAAIGRMDARKREQTVLPRLRRFLGG